MAGYSPTSDPYYRSAKSAAIKADKTIGYSSIYMAQWNSSYKARFAADLQASQDAWIKDPTGFTDPSKDRVTLKAISEDAGKFAAQAALDSVNYTKTLTGPGAFFRGVAGQPDPAPPKSLTDKVVGSAFSRVNHTGALVLQDPKSYKWNLPPHMWSRPFFPSSSPRELMPSGYSKPSSNDMYRRGRIWWQDSADIALEFGNSFSGSAVSTNSWTDLTSRQWGFQFIWNPESYATSTQVQMETTPNAADQWLGAAGIFPGTETVSFTVYIDRTNDFACANSVVGRPSQISGSTSIDFVTDTLALKDFSKFYTSSGGFITLAEGQAGLIQNIKDLLQRGTLADIEYLFKAINGPGPDGSSTYKNPRGVATSDIGYLIPNLVNIDIGPTSYIGWATSLNVTHTGFTPDMIPIRSEVSVAFNVMSTYGVKSVKTTKATK